MAPEYTDRVRRLFAICLLAIFTALVAADPLICPDGCTDAAQHASQSSHPGACLTCQNGIVSTDLADPINAPTLIAFRLAVLACGLCTSPAHAIEHPPRFIA